MTNTLNRRQRNLLTELYTHQITNGESEGTFRQRYEDGCQQSLWDVDDALKLEQSGLARISQELLLAGIICVGITNSGRKYLEAI